MKIVVCGSMAFVDEMDALARTLRAEGGEVTTPTRDEAGVAWSDLTLAEATETKRAYVLGYLNTIRGASVVLIANFEKHGVPGYIGPNTLIEAAFGQALSKPVIFLHHPGEQACRLEALSLMTSCLDGDIRKLRSALAR